MEFYQFKKPGFRKRQSAKLRDANNRQSILIDVDIVSDGKSLLIHAQKDYTLFPLYIHILGKLDLETESWLVRKSEFDTWARRTFADNAPNFKIEKRLQWLNDNDLIKLNPIQTAPKPSVNSQQTIGKPEINTPFRPAETLEYPEKDHPYIRQPKQDNPQTPKGPDAFDKFWTVYPNKQKKEYARKIWSREKLDSKLEEIIRGVEMYKKSRQWQKDGGDFIPHGSTFLNQRLWLDDLNENGVAVGKKAYWQRVKEAPIVHVHTNNGVAEVPGSDLQWDDTSKQYQWNGVALYADQVRIPEAS